MPNYTRQAVLFLFALALAGLTISTACADTKWPSLMHYTLSLSTNEDARYQASLGFSGPIGENLGAKVAGWWIGGAGDTRAFVGDAYIDYTRKPLYLAGGRKYVTFGPIGVLVSPGLFGGHLKIDLDRWDVQALAGTLQFTPGVGITRFSFSGARQPSDVSTAAVRVAGPLTGPEATVPVKLGLNWIRLKGDSGTSVDLQVEPNKRLTVFGEAATFDAHASVYGIKWSDEKLRTDGKVWIVVIYHRDVEVGFVPATVGASAFFENQRGVAGGIYHQLDARHALGLFADSHDAIVTWFTTVPL
jgi:hypothetical protein